LTKYQLPFIIIDRLCFIIHMHPALASSLLLLNHFINASVFSLLYQQLLIYWKT